MSSQIPKTDCQFPQAFEEISQNNSSVESAIDGLVDNALSRCEKPDQHRDAHQVKKTSLLVLLFGLFSR